MTDYAAMPDRDIDALVAERVMRQKYQLRNALGSVHADVPHYSTIASAALEAAKKFEQSDGNGDRFVSLCGDWQGGWCATAHFHRLKDGVQVLHADPARAICEAILQATESE